MLESFASKTRDKAAALKFIKSAMKRHGKPPRFPGEYGGLAEGVVQAMRKVYLHSDIPAYLDPGAVKLLQEARSAFNRFGLLETSILQHGSSLILFPWLGAKSQLALTLALRAVGLKVWLSDFALECPDTKLEDLKASLSIIADSPAPDPVALAHGGDLELDKFDYFLTEDMQSKNFARAMLDTASIPEICRGLFPGFHSP